MPDFSIKKVASIVRRTLDLLLKRKALKLAERRYRRSHAAFLKKVDPDIIDGVFIRDDDPAKSHLLSVYNRGEKVDLEILEEELPEAVARKVIHEVTYVVIAIPGNKTGRFNKIRQSFNNLASNYHGGYVHNIYVARTAESTEVQQVCKKAGIPFPEDAFESSWAISDRTDPKLRPFDS